MKPGSWEVNLQDATPKRIRQRALVSSADPKFFGHVVITGLRTAESPPSRTSLVKQALYMGIHKRSGEEGLKLGGPHALAWLGDEQGKGNLTGTLWGAGTPWANMVNYAWTNAHGYSTDAGQGIVQGTYYQNPWASLTEAVQVTDYQTLREIFDQLSPMWGGMEYRVRTNSSGGLQCDFGRQGTNGLFKFGAGNRTVCLLSDDGGRDVGLVGLQMVSPLRYGFDADSYENGQAIETQTLGPLPTSYFTIPDATGVMTGGGVRAGVFFRGKSSVNTDDPNAINTLNGAWLAKYMRFHRTASATVREYAVTRFVTPGDEVLLYDPTNDLVDVTVAPTVFRGQLLYPLAVRCTEVRWPIEEGMGVYLISGDGNNTVTDLTDYVAWETGQPTVLTLGEPPRPMGPAMAIASDSV